MTSTSRPEGWWSSDDVAGTEPSTPMANTPPSPADSRLSVGEANQKVRRMASRNSLELFGEKGITLGKAGAVGGGLSRDGAFGIGVGGGSDDNKKRRKRRKE